MIIQLFLVYIIIMWAAGMTLYRIFHFFRPAGTKCQGCSGCAVKTIHARKTAAEKVNRSRFR